MNCALTRFHLQKYCFLMKLRHFSQKKLQQSYFRGCKHIDFLDSKKWSSPMALKAGLNKTQLWFAWFACVMWRASCFEQVTRFHTAKRGVATRYRFRAKSAFLTVSCEFAHKRAALFHVAEMYLFRCGDFLGCKAVFSFLQFFLPRPVFSCLGQIFSCLRGFFPLSPECSFSAAKVFFCCCKVFFFSCFEFFPLRSDIFCWFFPLRIFFRPTPLGFRQVVQHVQLVFPAAETVFSAPRRFFPAAKLFFRSDVFFPANLCFCFSRAVVSMANLCSWLFLLDLAPFAFCFACLLDGETQIWLGICVSPFVLLFLCLVLVLWFAMLHNHLRPWRIHFKLLLHVQGPSLRAWSAIQEKKNVFFARCAERRSRERRVIHWALETCWAGQRTDNDKSDQHWNNRPRMKSWNVQR